MCGPKRIVTRKHLILEVTQYGHSRIFEKTKLNGGLSQLHSADEDAVSWLTNYGK